MDNFNGTSELDAMLGNQVSQNVQDFNIVFNKDVNDGISIINYDPKNCGIGIYKNAIFAVLDVKREKSVNAEWVKFECSGLNKRFIMKWFDYGNEPNMERFVGKLVSCDIETNSYGKTAKTEPVVLEVDTVKDEQFNQAVEYLKVEAKLNTNLNNFVNDCSFFDLMSKQKAKIEVIKLALKIKIAKFTSNMYPTSDIHSIVSALFMRSMEVLVESSDYSPDFVIYANIYKQFWKGNDIAKLFVRNSTYSNIDAHVLRMSEEYVDNIISGSALI